MNYNYVVVNTSSFHFSDRDRYPGGGNIIRFSMLI